MKTLCLCSLVLLLYANTVFSQPVSVETAKTVAKNFYYERAYHENPGIKYSEINLKRVFTETAGGDSIYYVFNAYKGKGWIVVSAQQNVLPVLAYSLEENYDTIKENQPPAFTDWMDNYKEQILYCINNHIVPDTSAISKWSYYIAYSPTKGAPKDIQAVAPLFGSMIWHQNCYYNQYCPAFSGGPCSRAMAGCGATSLAQVMKYWNWPPQGSGSRSYTPATYPSLGTQSANFANTTYDWANMPYKLTSSSTSTQKSAVATLLRHCGVAMSMDYGCCGGGASASYMWYYSHASQYTALINHFKYSSSLSYKKKSSYSNSTWQTLLRDNLDNGWPLTYFGNNGGSGSNYYGHLFNCDGYGYNGDDNLFHFNWGWHGSCNGYFTVTDLTPGSYTFNSGQSALFNIVPISPSAPGSISGSTSVCIGQTETYTVPEITNATSYIWVLPTGATGSSSTNSITVTYGIGAVSGNITVKGHNPGGDGPAATLSVSINTGPVLMATPASQSLCSGTAASIALTSTPSGASFLWTVSQSGITGASSGSGSNINQTLVNSGTTTGTAIYTVIPSIGSCVGSGEDITITVKPNPVTTSTPASQTICSGTATAVTLSSGVAGTSFNWTVNAPDINGESNGSGSSIAQTLTNATTANQTATYTITPTANGCSGVTSTVIITVKPKPVVISTPASQSICSGASTGIALSSDVSGTTFAWTVSQSGVTGAGSGSGSNISQALSNSGTTAGTAIFSITPTANNCTGTGENVIVTVKPVPNVIATPTVQNICSETTTNISLSSDVSGATFSWTVNNPDITGESNGSGSSIAQALTNTSSANQIAIYTVTPSASACIGGTTTVSVTVKPMPVLSATPSSQNICSGAATGIALTSSVNGTDFSWTVVQSGVTGASNGNGSNIDQSLIYSASPGAAVYTVTPVASSCNGTPVTVAVSVSPIPVISDVTKADPAVCGTSTGVITITATGATQYSIDGGITWAGTENFTGLSSGNYSVIVKNADGCTEVWPSVIEIAAGEAPYPSAAGTDDTICEGTSVPDITATAGNGGSLKWYLNSTLIGTGSTLNPNPFLTIGTNTFYVTETTGCEGAGRPVTIAVNPIPAAVATPASETFCDGEATSILLNSTVAGTEYNYTVTQSGVTGGSSGNSNPITQVLHNAGIMPGMAIYTIIPVASGCMGSPVTVTINVKPKPVLTASPSSQAVCSGEATNINLSSNISGTSYSWIVAQTGTTGAADGSGASIYQPLYNSFVTPGTVTYTIIPEVNACSGNASDVTVTVNPVPVFVTTPASQELCSGDTTGIVLSSDVAGTTYFWTVLNSSGNVTGSSAGSGNGITQTLINSGSDIETVTYHITPSTSFCQGNAENVVITVKPIPDVSGTPEIICSGEMSNINLGSAVTGTIFSWTVQQTDVTGAADSSGTNIGQTLFNSGETAGTAIYTITPAADGCIGNATDITVTVNPIPVLTVTPSSPAACSGDTSHILLGSGVSGTTFSWTAYQFGCSGASAGTGNAIEQILFNPGNINGTTTYRVSPVANSCTGIPVNITVTVYPLPALTVNPYSSDICLGDTISLNAGGASTYTWSPATGLNCATGNIVAASPVNTTTYSIAGASVYGCLDTKTITINVNPLPVITCTPDSATVCLGNSVNLIAGGAGNYIWLPDTSLSFLWNSEGGLSDTVMAHPDSTTTYTITGLSDLGCENSKTVTVYVKPLPVIIAGSSSGAFCSGGSVTLSGAGALTYIWDHGVTDNVSFAPTATTTYHVTGTDTNGCQNDTFITIIVYPLPIISCTPAAPSICNENSITITASGADNYIWSPAAGLSNTSGATVTADPDTTSTYSITGTSAEGCIGSATVTVSINQEPVITVTPAIPSVCSGDSVTLTASGTDAYSWSPATGLSDSTGAAVTAGPTATTSYTVTGTSTGGCVGTETVTVTVKPLPAIPVITQQDHVLTASQAAAYQWYLDGDIIAGATSQDYTVTQDGNYSVLVFNASGCQAVSLPYTVINVGMEFSSVETPVSIYPNPNTGSFIIRIGKTWAQAANISLSNVLGQQIYSENIKSGTTEILLKNIPQGFYLLHVYVENKIFTNKIIVNGGH